MTTVGKFVRHGDASGRISDSAGQVNESSLNLFKYFSKAGKLEQFVLLFAPGK
jgi:hypothetical protein